MIEAIQSLLRLQEIDLLLHAAREEMASFGPQREAAAASRVEERDAAVTAEQGVTEAELRHRALEGELSEVEGLLEKLNTQIYEVTSKQALKALQSELDRAGSGKSALEDQILELLDEIDSGTNALEAAREAEREGASTGQRDGALRADREGALTGEMGRLDALRDERASFVDAAIIRSYDGARRKRLPAVVFVEAKSCPVCRIVISPQKLIDLRAANSLVHCGSCDRILYGDKVADAEREVAG